MAMDETSPSNNVVEINLLSVLRRRWHYVLLGTTIGLCLAGIYHFAKTREYESHIEILVGQRSSELTNSGTMSSSTASGDSIQDDQLSTHMRLLAGRKTIASAIENEHLDELHSLRTVADTGGNLIDFILDHLEISRGGDGSARDAMVLRATYTDVNPEHAAIILNAIFESYRSYIESHGQHSTEEAVALIEQARETHELELAEADEVYRNFISSVPILIEGDKAQEVHKERLAKLEAEVNSVRTHLAESRARLAIIQSFVDTKHELTNDADHMALLSEKEVERLKLFIEMTQSDVHSEEFQAEQPIRQEAAKIQYNRLLDLIQKERSLSDAYGAGHPLVEAARKEIEITQRFIESNAPTEARPMARKMDPKTMLDTYRLLLQHDIAERENRLTILQKDADEELQLAKGIENDFLKGTSLKARLHRAQARYDEVIRRLNELNLTKSYAGFSTDLLAAPEIAKNPAWPRLPIVGGLGLIIGVFMGISLAIAAELLDSTFSDVHELEAVTGAVAIAHVPRFDPRTILRNANTSSVSPAIVTFHAPRSAEAEIYRVARTSLLLTTRKADIRTMMMTSAQPGDGKSTTISNLAVSFARAGKRVLLIDGDMRRPVLAKTFDMTSELGLADILSGCAELNQSIVRSPVENLDLLTHGTVTSEPAELLESFRLRALLEEASKRYDLTLIDAPPVLAVADPTIIAPIVDAVLMTVRVCKNGRRPVEQAIKILKDIGIPPTAVIVNGVDSSTRGVYQYGGYSRNKYDYVGRYHSRYAAAETDSSSDVTVKIPQRTVG